MAILIHVFLPMKQTNQKGFTLVELIVVITILVILGTVSFLSFQGMAADARDSRRSSDLWNIQQAIDLSIIKGSPVNIFVLGTGSTITHTNTGPTVGANGSRIRLSGIEWYGALSGTYVGGDVNYNVLWLKQENFSDPTKTTTAYKIGVTYYNGSYYELAATIENGWSPKSLIDGTYVPRLWSNNYAGVINSGSNVFTFSGKLAIETGFRVKDVVEFTSTGGLFTVTKINSDSIEVSPTWSTSQSNTVHINADETPHLIKRWGPSYTGDNYRIDTVNLKGAPYDIN